MKADNSSAELMSNDMHKEMLRQKWEEEELAAMNQPIHYANVQYDGKMEVDSAVYLFSKHFLFCISWISYCNSLNWSTFYFYRYVFNSFLQQSYISFIQMLTPSLLELHQRKQICVHAFHLPRTEKNNWSFSWPNTYIFFNDTEIRTHGVGFYQFAKDEESRKEQLDTLNDIRDKVKYLENQQLFFYSCNSSLVKTSVPDILDNY